MRAGSPARNLVQQNNFMAPPSQAANNIGFDPLAGNAAFDPLAGAPSNMYDPLQGAAPGDMDMYAPVESVPYDPISG